MASRVDVGYLALQFDAKAGDAEAWSDQLIEAGALAVDASDARAGTPEETSLYGEPGGPPVVPWPVSRLVALFADDVDAVGAVAQAAVSLSRSLPSFATWRIDERDWVRATHAQFGPMQVGARLWIVPSWSDPPDPLAINLCLDPGLAFGTGSHPTTRLCLCWLEANFVRGETLLDYGCGSGILAIAAAKLGARAVLGTDIDSQAIAASVSNAAANSVAATFAFPDSLPPGPFDVVVANILANPLILLAPALAGRVRPGGRIVLSGILESQGTEVREAYEPWFNIAPSQIADSWVLLVGDRRPSRP